MADLFDRYRAKMVPDSLFDDFKKVIKPLGAGANVCLASVMVSSLVHTVDSLPIKAVLPGVEQLRESQQKLKRLAVELYAIQVDQRYVERQSAKFYLDHFQCHDQWLEIGRLINGMNGIVTTYLAFALVDYSLEVFEQCGLVSGLLHQRLVETADCLDETVVAMAAGHPLIQVIQRRRQGPTDDDVVRGLF